jgi:predicted nucleic acid-binding protein
MYLLGEIGDYGYQRSLWGLRAAQKLILLDLTAAEIDRMAELMGKYSDTPMDLADASLVAVAESRRLRLLFTLDSDFYIYRLQDGSALALIP